LGKIKLKKVMSVAVYHYKRLMQQQDDEAAHEKRAQRHRQLSCH
jgi:ATP-dependent protease Clp ATPase subunit